MKKMKTRKLLLLMAICTLFMLALTACGTERKKIETIDDLEGSRIGVQLGTTGDIYASDYEGDEAGTEVIRYNAGADAVEALKQGKIDAVIIDEQPAKVFVEKNSDLKILNEEFTDEDYAAVISKDNDELLNKVNKAIDELQADGTLDKLEHTYINKTGDFHYTQTVTDGEKLVMATNAYFPPYEYYDGGTIMGYDVEFGYAIADKLGMVLEIEDMEFDAIINAVSSGKADIGLAGFTITEERLKSINFSDSYIKSRQVIIVYDK